jgi:branched-chain amino acid transport system substrate-binding protein
MRNLKVVGFLMAIAFTVLACGGESSTGGETVAIGSLHPLTGPLATNGSQMDDAVAMAVEDINSAGGIEALDGAELEVLSSDTQGDPATAQDEAQRLAEEGAVALVGTYQSAATTNVARMAERLQVPLVIDVTVADEILQQGYQYTFRIQPDATGMGTFGARYLRQISEQAGSPVQSVSYIHESSEFGTSVFGAFAAEAEQLGIEIANETTYDALAVSDLTSEVTQAAAAQPEVIVVTGYYEDGLILTSNLSSVRPDVEGIYGVANAAFDAPQFPGDAGDSGRSFLSTNYHWDATSERARDIRERFQERTGQEMRTEAMYSYQGVEVIAEALERAGSSEPQALRDAISETSLETDLLPFPGPIEFDDTGQNVNARPISMQVQEGEVLQVYPEEFAEERPVFPAVPWNEGA